MKKKVAVVMPAYNAARTLEKTYREIPHHLVDDIILVDDCSTDDTSLIAKNLGIHVIRHEKNTGYGSNQKSCYQAALERGADVIAMIHADYQYDPKALPLALDIILNDEADVAYGSRMIGENGAKIGQMPLYKRFGNVFLTWFTNVMLGTTFTDAATGYIVRKRKVLEAIPFQLNNDGYWFDEQTIAQSAVLGFTMKEFPILTRYEDESSSISLAKCILYGFGTMQAMLLARLSAWNIYHSHLFVPAIAKTGDQNERPDMPSETLPDKSRGI